MFGSFKSASLQKKVNMIFLSNSPSSFFQAKKYFSCFRTNFLSHCALAIASILFSNYYALLFKMFIICNVYFQRTTFVRLQLWTMFKDKTPVYKFQLKPFFKRNNVILSQVFLIKSEKSISEGVLISAGDGRKYFTAINKWGRTVTQDRKVRRSLDVQEIW